MEQWLNVNVKYFVRVWLQKIKHCVSGGKLTGLPAGMGNGIRYRVFYGINS